MAAITILFMSASFSSHVCATERVLDSAAANASNYAAVNHSQESVESTNRQPAIVGVIPIMNTPIVNPAYSISSQFMVWYSALGRHEKALTFELLMIGCYIALRIYSSRKRSGQQSELPGKSTSTNSLIGENK
jgi:hypothetical protein